MTSITTWTRIEAWPHDALEVALEARVADPAWLLARQWQLGELGGEDAASPVELRLGVQPIPIISCRRGSQVSRLDGLPLDYMVGAEPSAPPTAIEIAEAGAELVGSLRAHGCRAELVEQLVRRYPIPAVSGDTDPAGAHLLSLLGPELPDSLRLEALLRRTAQDGAPPRELEIAGPDAAGFVAAAQQWVQWRDVHVAGPPPGDAWRPDRLECEFSITAQADGLSPVELVAREWHGELLDWYHIDGAALGASTATGASHSATGGMSLSCTPSHLSYPGMPLPRYWQFEDARVSFAKVACSESDLARLIVLGFVNAYGNDWYLIPLTLPVGCLHVVRSLVVKDTFGDEQVVHAFGSSSPPGAGGSSASEWSLFRTTAGIAGSSGELGGLLLLAGVEPICSEPLEVVRFVRDESANLAWAIEATTTGTDGRPQHHSPAIVVASVPSGSAAGEIDEPWQYRVMSEVPAHWHPLVLDNAQRFVLDPERRPKGRALSPDMGLRQEEIPAEGVDLFRRYHLARSADGRTVVWIGRRKRVGQGGGASGLRFDDVAPSSR